MKVFISALGMALLLGSFAAALAQSPVAEDTVSEAGVDEPLDPCLPGSETDGTGDGTADGQSDAADCEEQALETTAAEVPLPGEAAEDNFADDEYFEPETTGDDVTAEEEIESGEEISEDFPVPLPADI